MILDHILSNGRLAEEWFNGRDLKEIVLKKSMQYSGICWKNYRKPQKETHSGWTMTQPRFETDVSQIQV